MYTENQNFGFYRKKVIYAKSSFYTTFYVKTEIREYLKIELQHINLLLLL